MKNVFYGAVLTFILILCVLVGSTISSRNTRQTELDSAVSNAAESTIKELTREHQLLDPSEYKISTDKDLQADFTQRLMKLLAADSDIQINFLKSNATTGLLSVNVVETYKHPIGKKGRVESTATVIMDTYGNPQKNDDSDNSETLHTFIYYKNDVDISHMKTSEKEANKLYTLTETEGYIRDKNFKVAGPDETKGQYIDKNGYVVEADGKTRVQVETEDGVKDICYNRIPMPDPPEGYTGWKIKSCSGKGTPPGKGLGEQHTKEKWRSLYYVYSFSEVTEFVPVKGVTD